MDHAVLVDIDVNAGARVVDVLEAGGTDFDVALFATFPEYYSPRLVIAAEWLAPFSQRERYEKISDALSGKLPKWNQPHILIMKMTDPFIEDLRIRLSGIPDIRGMRLGGYSFGGRYLEDGYVFRVK